MFGWQDCILKLLTTAPKKGAQISEEMMIKEFFYTTYSAIEQPKFEDEEDEDDKEYEKFLEQQSYKD